MYVCAWVCASKCTEARRGHQIYLGLEFRAAVYLAWVQRTNLRSCLKEQSVLLAGEPGLQPQRDF